MFDNKIKNASSVGEVKKFIESGNIVRCGFCSIANDGASCAERIEKETGAEVRGVRLEKEKTSGKCVVCGKKAGEVVYVGRSY